MPEHQDPTEIQEHQDSPTDTLSQDPQDPPAQQVSQEAMDSPETQEEMEILEPEAEDSQDPLDPKDPLDLQDRTELPDKPATQDRMDTPEALDPTETLDKLEAPDNQELPVWVETWAATPNTAPAQLVVDLPQSLAVAAATTPSPLPRLMMATVIALALTSAPTRES